MKVIAGKMRYAVFMFRGTRPAFTLIELLVVIAIIGLLAAVVLASLGLTRGKGQDAAVKSELHSASSQAELYALSTSNSYAGVCTAAKGSGFGGSTAGGILYAAAAPTNNSAYINTTNTTGGSYNTVTCHDSGTAWALEAPLTASVSGSPVMWCVDSSGIASQKSSNIAGSIMHC